MKSKLQYPLWIISIIVTGLLGSQVLCFGVCHIHCKIFVLDCIKVKIVHSCLTWELYQSLLSLFMNELGNYYYYFVAMSSSPGMSCTQDADGEWKKKNEEKGVSKVRQTLCWTRVHLSQHATPLSVQPVYNYTGRDTGNRRAAWVTRFMSREKKKPQSVARARPGLAELWVLTRTLPRAPLLNCGPSSCPLSTDSRRHKAWCQRGSQETDAAYGMLNNVQ